MPVNAQTSRVLPTYGQRERQSGLQQGCIKLSISPLPPVRWGMKSKVFEMGKKSKARKKRKQKIFVDLTLLAVPNGSV